MVSVDRELSSEIQSIDLIIGVGLSWLVERFLGL